CCFKSSFHLGLGLIRYAYFALTLKASDRRDRLSSALCQVLLRPFQKSPCRFYLLNRCHLPLAIKKSMHYAMKHSKTIRLQCKVKLADFHTIPCARKVAVGFSFKCGNSFFSGGTNLVPSLLNLAVDPCWYISRLPVRIR